MSLEEEKEEKQILDEKISSLSPVEKEILEFCSLFPGEFSLEDVFPFRPYPFLERIFNRLEEANLFYSRGKGKFVFPQPWKNLVCEELPELKRRAVHAFLARQAVDNKKPDKEIAFHFFHSQEPEKGIPFALRAMSEYKKKFALEKRHFFLKSCSSLMLKNQSESRKYEFFLMRGELFFFSGDFTQSVEDLRRALFFARSPAEKSRSTLLLAAALFEAGDYHEAVRVSEENKSFLFSLIKLWSRTSLISKDETNSPETMRAGGHSFLRAKGGAYPGRDKSFANPERTSGLSSLMAIVLALIKEEIPSQRVLAYLETDRGKLFFQDSGWFNFGGSKGFIKEVVRKTLEEKSPVLVNDLNTGAVFSHIRGVLDFNLGRILCVPLFINGRAAGAVYLDRRKDSEPFSRKNLEFLASVLRTICPVLGEKLKVEKPEAEHSVNSAGSLIGKSKAFLRILKMVDKVKDISAPVFISGESGTGKELVAREIHYNGLRKKGQFVAVNCGAIPENLLEAELFGYARGAFTGAVKARPGLIEEAGEGTFFLDEIGDLPLRLQAKLLRVIQEKEIRRLGENSVRRVDVRFICATNKNIEKEVERGNFREDLYYRLKIVIIEIPPLRERKEDVLLLINYFLDKHCREMKKGRVFFSPRALELLRDYHWPGNVRELQNEIQRCLIFAGEESLIKEEFLSSAINPEEKTHSVTSYDYFQAKAEFEKRFLSQALARCGYNKVRTAEEIGLTRQGLFKLMKKHSIDSTKSVKQELF